METEAVLMCILVQHVVSVYYWQTVYICKIDEDGVYYWKSHIFEQNKPIKINIINV